ncbi:MAG: hypothetical protein WBX01_02395 [Nitrososphaeraceae archaeon]
MRKMFSLIICGIFTALLLPVISTEGVANSSDRDLDLNASKPYTDHPNILASTNNISKESISDFIFEQDSHPYNLTYADWTAKWWQWAYFVPADKDPSYDDTGKYCSENQKAPVWFLTLSFGHPATRSCYIPQNTALLVTLLNSECSYAEYANLTNEFELRDCAKEQQDHVVSPMASINGIKIPNLENYRIQSSLFNFTLPANNILDLPAQTTQAVSDGNWLFLKPLPPGNYDLKLKGNIAPSNNTGSSFAFAGPVGWNYTTTYRLTVN